MLHINRNEVNLMGILKNYIYTMIFALVVMNLGGIVHFKVFCAFTWKETKKALIIISIFVVLVCICFYVFQELD